MVSSRGSWVAVLRPVNLVPKAQRLFAGQRSPAALFAYSAVAIPYKEPTPPSTLPNPKTNWLSTNCLPDR
jgi:hypothetical protein